jgi:hypothetical protein
MLLVGAALVVATAVAPTASARRHNCGLIAHHSFLAQLKYPRHHARHVSCRKARRVARRGLARGLFGHVGNWSCYGQSADSFPLITRCHLDYRGRRLDRALVNVIQVVE